MSELMRLAVQPVAQAGKMSLGGFGADGQASLLAIFSSPFMGHTFLRRQGTFTERENRPIQATFKSYYAPTYRTTEFVSFGCCPAPIKLAAMIRSFPARDALGTERCVYSAPVCLIGATGSPPFGWNPLANVQHSPNSGI